MWHVLETGEMHTEFWQRSPTEKTLGKPRRRWEVNIKIGSQQVEWRHGIA
jgi:hypothetical protein